jgi:hypothetical protein
MLDKRLHLLGEYSLRDSSTENSSADTDPYYGRFLGERELLWGDFLGSNVYKMAYIEGTGPT